MREHDIKEYFLKADDHYYTAMYLSESRDNQADHGKSIFQKKYSKKSNDMDIER
jgi:hypothetical protein